MVLPCSTVDCMLNSSGLPAKLGTCKLSLIYSMLKASSLKNFKLTPWSMYKQHFELEQPWIINSILNSRYELPAIIQRSDTTPTQELIYYMYRKFSGLSKIE